MKGLKVTGNDKFKDVNIGVRVSLERDWMMMMIMMMMI